MLVFAFIGVFILGGIVGIAGITVLAMRIANMGYDDMSRAGEMIVEAGNNRESAMTLEYIDENAEKCRTIVFAKE